MKRNALLKMWMVVFAAILFVSGCRAGVQELPNGQTLPAKGEPTSPATPPANGGPTSPGVQPAPGEQKPPGKLPAPADPPPPESPPDQPAPLPASYLRLLKPDALLGGETAPYLTVELPPNTDTHAIHVQADRNVAILYPSPWTQSSGIYLLDLTTGTASSLTGPDPGGWYAYASLRPDGRLLLVGRQLWIGDPAADQFEAVAELDLTWLVVPSPSGRYLALWGPNAKGDYTIVDLQTNEVQTRTGPFRRCAQDGGVTLAWSPDERHLAGTDCDNDATGEGARTRIVDPFTGEQVRSIDGHLLTGWLPDGRILARVGRISSETALLDASGVVVDTLSGYVRPSPDGRYLHQTLDDGEQRQFLINLATGDRVPIEIKDSLRWTETGDIFIINRP